METTGIQEIDIHSHNTVSLPNMAVSDLQFPNYTSMRPELFDEIVEILRVRLQWSWAWYWAALEAEFCVLSHVRFE